MAAASLVLAAVVCLLACAGAAAQNDRSLYTFTRTDGPVTHVRLGMPDPGAPRIHPRVYSNFLEHLGPAIYEGLWANAVYNPCFALDAAGAPIRWTFTGGAEPRAEGPSGGAALLPTGARIAQALHVPLHRALRYRAGLWARAAERSGKVRVRLFRAGNDAPLASAELNVAAGDWTRKPFTLTVPPGEYVRGSRCELAIECVGGSVALTCVEVFPADALDGADPDVVRLTRALRNELLRWPGGNFASGYRWKQGVGPRQFRPTVPNPAWRGLETHHFGTDEFLQFCRRTGAQPQICVNAGNGTPEEAAEWVQYCNGSADTPMGRLRAQNGRPQPYDVRVWEIGNELYGDWQIGHTDAAGNAARFVAFRRAMLAADPTIEILATGKGDSYAGGGIDLDRRWNAAVLTAARADRHGPPEYLSVHPLVSLPGNLVPRYGYDEVYRSALAHPEWWWRTYIPTVRALLREHAPGATRLAPTEWGIIVGGQRWSEFPNHNNIAGALYAALYFHAMFRAADVVTLSNVTALMHGGGIARPAGVAVVHPMYHVQRMYAGARPDRVLPVHVDGPAYDVPERGFLPGVQAVPWVDAAAGTARGTRWLFLVNRHRDQARSAQITLDGPGRVAEVETLAAPPQAGNSLETPDRVAPARSQVAVDGRALRLDLPPASVTAVRIR